ncbi:MAG: DEAD/DEAH box helicase [Thermoanaerobaculia bacterium]|nr:DEAD/DEAH box helicase [Thermoanaerobaculia bacterium]
MRILRDASALAEHQLAAVRRLRSVIERSGGAILADEPGLGKSYIAAALALEEQQRGGSVELIVPASLVRQWRGTLSDFGVRARVMTHDALRGDSSVAQPSRRLIVVDEAHAFRNPKTQRYSALARRSPGARVLLVTATPVCNSARDLESLIRLIAADDAIAGVPSIDRAFAVDDRQMIARVVDAIVIRRGREVLPEHLRFGDLKRHVIRFVVSDDGLIASLRFPLVRESPLLRSFLWRRLESSEAALLESVRRQRRFYERALECLASGRTLAKSDYRRAFGHEEDAAAVQTVLFWEMFVPEETKGSAGEIEEEIERLDALRDLLHASPRAKEQRLISICREHHEPVLIFTGWAATAVSLHDAIRRVRRSALVTGRERTRADGAIEAFRAGAVDVLVSTDLAAEGLNLQRAGLVVHYDVPWNPVKLDQRNGRAHRIGQRRATVGAIYFVPDGDRSRVFHTVAAKNRTRRRLSSGEGEGSPVLHLRPRVTRDAAIVPFIAAAQRAGWCVPEAIDRRHKAGIEQLLAELAIESLTEAKLRDLEALLSLEPWAASRLIRFTNL